MTEFAQQLLNGLALGSIYALIALGYTMVYGVLRFINFAHSDVLMLGAFAAFYLEAATRHMAASAPLLHAGMVVMGAALICAVLGVLIERLAYRPLRDRPRITVLITAIGVSLLIEYTCQHPSVFGAATRSFPQLFPQSNLTLGGLTVGSNDLVVLGITTLLLVLLAFMVQKTKLGVAMRAVAFNPQAASLMGVDVGRIISLTFALGSALAAVAGIAYALRSPGIEPLMGVQPGIKAFIAAVLGGIGNLPGAVLGGLLLGLIETFAGGLKQISNYRDAIAFALLIAILMLRPAGLLGREQPEKV